MCGCAVQKGMIQYLYMIVQGREPGSIILSFQDSGNDVTVRLNKDYGGVEDE